MKKQDFTETVTTARANFMEKFKLEGFTVEFISGLELREILDVHYRDVFTDISMMRFEISQSERERCGGVFQNYMGVHMDSIVLRDSEGNFAGHFMGESEDWASYYLRNAGLIPKWRRQAIASKFVDLFCDYLYELGYARVTSQHIGTNNAVLIMMLKFGFHIAGVETREEWGTMVKCVKLLTPEREKAFDSALYGGR